MKATTPPDTENPMWHVKSSALHPLPPQKKTFNHHSNWDLTLGKIWARRCPISATNATLSQPLLLIAITEFGEHLSLYQYTHSYTHSYTQKATFKPAKPHKQAMDINRKIRNHLLLQNNWTMTLQVGIKNLTGKMSFCHINNGLNY